MSFNFFTQTDLVFGRDSLQTLPETLSRLKLKKLLLVYDQGVKFAGISEKVITLIKSAGIEFIEYDRVLPNPANQAVEDVALIAREAKVDGFVAVGGGSPIDLAKAVNVLMTNSGRISDYGGINKVRNAVLPLIAIPTTAGTSSEITNVVALMDEEAVCKYVVIDNKIVASNVIIDPELTRTLPQSVTAATGMDAITHAVESYISTMSNALTEYHSLHGLKLLYENLPLVVEDGNNIQAREQMMLGCVITGYAFSNANLGLVHGIAHTLSAHFHLPHGMANAAVLPYVMEFNASSCPEKMVDLAKAIGLKITGNMEEDKYLLSHELVKLTKKIGIKTLSEQGVSESDFEMLAQDVLKEPVLNFNPRNNITRNDILSILKKAL